MAVRTLDRLPSSIEPIAKPILFGVSAGLDFIIRAKERGFSDAIDQKRISPDPKHIAPSVASALWHIVSLEMDPDSANSPFGRLAENAFKKTINVLLTKGAAVNQLEAERNIREFLDQKGDDGFVSLLLSNYLFELSMYYLHSGKNSGYGVKQDTGYRFYVDGRNRPIDPGKLEDFKKDLRAECEKKANLVVQRLRESELLKPLTKEQISDPEVAKLLRDAFREIATRT